MRRSSDWLDTETRAILSRGPPGKLAPPAECGFSVVLLERGPDRARLMRALELVLPANDSPDRILGLPCPTLVRTRLDITDALLAQFELICADSISVFVRDDVALEGDPGYRCT